MRGIMARKEMITIDKILDTAFAMTREEGFANVTARRVAAKAGCSTQPIFRVYKNMEELWDAVYEIIPTITSPKVPISDCMVYFPCLLSPTPIMRTAHWVAEGLYSAWHCAGFSGAHAIL